MSEVKVNKVSPRSGTTLTIGDSGDTTNVVGTLNNNGATLLSLANGVNNRVITSSSATALNGEANLTFDGSTLGVDGAATFNQSGADKDFRVESDGNENMLVVDGGTNRVGIGIAAPVAPLTVGSNSSGGQGVTGKTALFSGTLTSVYNAGNNGTFGGITIVNSDSTSNRTAAGVNFVNGSSGVSSIVGTSTAASKGDLRFITRGADNSGNTSERMQITNDGAVLIGTTTIGSAAAGDLVVNGGVFLGGTAAANELDDYEEGNWTPGVTFGGGNTGVNSGASAGSYTKVGRLVMASGLLLLSSKGSSTGNALLTGLPFTAGSGNKMNGAVSFAFIERISFNEVLTGTVGTDSTTASFFEAVSGNVTSNRITNSDFNNATGLRFTITYQTN